MEKINLVELLKDCPEGMELDCTMYNKVTLLNVDRKDICFPIRVKREDGNSITLTKYGQYTDADFAKCVIFPTGKTTWEGFVPPCKFKAGDVLVSEMGNIVLLSHIDSENIVHYHCIIPTCGSFRIEENTNIGVGRYYECVLANEQQRQRMYDKIKCSRHKYNQSTNMLEKLVEPKFKVWDKVRAKNDKTIIKTINYIYHDSYGLCDNHLLFFKEQDEYELVPNKFDINTLVPFKSKVLVRNIDGDLWKPAIYGFSPSKGGCYVVGGTYWKQCIPYEGNEHLLGKTDDCDDFYKTWE